MESKSSWEAVKESTGIVFLNAILFGVIGWIWRALFKLVMPVVDSAFEATQKLLVWFFKVD